MLPAVQRAPAPPRPHHDHHRLQQQEVRLQDAGHHARILLQALLQAGLLGDDVHRVPAQEVLIENLGAPATVTES